VEFKLTYGGVTSPARRRRRVDAALPPMRLRPDIQGLRAVAVLLVVLSHAGVPAMTGGYIGVDVFFVLSGFLITSILLHEATERGSISLIGFYAKRARRILPAATAALAATALAATALLPYVRVDIILRDIAWSALFAANIHFGHQSTDYFASDLPPSPVQHFWSLAVEEQFYLVWPALIIVILITGSHHHPSTVRRRIPLLGLVVGVLAAVSLAWSIVLTGANPSGAYFSTPARCWELGAGALLAVAGRSLPLLKSRTRRVLAWTGFAMVMSAAFTFTDRTPVPGYHMVLPVAGSMALIAAGAGEPRNAPAVVRLLGKQPLRWIGDLSYGFYLWHWPFLVLASAYAGRELGLGVNLLLCCGALMTAWASYHLIEDPLRRGRSSSSRRHQMALLLWPTAIGCMLAVNIGSHAYIRYEQQAVATAAAKVDLSALPPSERVPRAGHRVHDAVAEAVDRAALDAPQAPLKDLTLLAEDWVKLDDRCVASETETKADICPMGDLGGDKTLVVLGDSHAMMWLPALEMIADREGYTLVPIIKLGCTPFNVVAWQFDRAEEFTECNQWRPWAMDQVRLARPDVVVVGSASVVVSVDQEGGGLLSLTESKQVWKEGARALAEQLLAVTPEVRFIADITRLPEDPAECLSNLHNTAADCTFTPSDWVKDSNNLVRTGVASTDAVHISLRNMFCLSGHCPIVVDGMVVYRDRDHLSSSYARFLVDEMDRRLGLPKLAGPLQVEGSDLPRHPLGWANTPRWVASAQWRTGRRWARNDPDGTSPTHP
jgi:peptidoglycan/LPS O-acetylase OafA/YrhL